MFGSRPWSLDSWLLKLVQKQKIKEKIINAFFFTVEDLIFNRIYKKRKTTHSNVKDSQLNGYQVWCFYSTLLKLI